ncbi:MAG TPA: diiron oxygenase [Bdellovibrionota bacterium]|nr:diiron oxygenase [Bdellovibrionota bacterium]
MNALNVSSETLAKKLSEISRKNYYSPYEQIVFDEALVTEGPAGAHWITSPELISIYGQPEWDALSETQRKALSFHEAVNFYSLNIHGEKSLIEGLAKRLYDKKNRAVAEYIHHFLDEENKHMVYFGTFCTKYAGKIYADRKISFPREYLPGEEEFLFFAKVMIFEEIVDVYNREMARDERLHPVARQINEAHHRDELRHLAFGRQKVKELWEEHSPKWGREKVEAVRAYLSAYIESTWREYYNPEVYKDAGIPDAYGLVERAFTSLKARVHRERIQRSCLEGLEAEGVL